MDAKYFKILSYLYSKGVGEYDNVSPILQQLYPGIDRMDGDRVRTESWRVNALLKSMTDNKLIEIHHYSIGGGSQQDGFSWVDTVQIKAAITQIGKDAVDTEKGKGETERLIESTILTNESVRETNSATIQNLRFQKTSQKWTIALGALSTIFIFTTIIQSIFDKTPEYLKDIGTQVQEQSKKLKKLDSSLQKINSSIQSRKMDTVYILQSK